MARGKKKVLTDVEKAKREQAKREAFVRVVTPRVNKALTAIRRIGLCASPNYCYTPQQVDVILEALTVAVELVSNAYARKASPQAEFSLPF